MEDLASSGSNPTSNGPQRAREEEVERLAQRIGLLIGSAEPETREELAQAANAILRDEGLRADSTASDTRDPAEHEQVDARKHPVNPLAAGIGLIVLGAALALLLPFVGLTLAILGALAMLWGLALSWSR